MIDEEGGKEGSSKGRRMYAGNVGGSEVRKDGD